MKNNLHHSISYITNGEIHLVIISGLLILGLLVILQPFILSRCHNKFESTIPSSNGPIKITSFFQIPYITWFLSHMGIASLVVLGIIGLAVDHVLTASTVAALLGSLLGYMLGSTNSHLAGTTNNNAQAPKDKNEDTSKLKDTHT